MKLNQIEKNLSVAAAKSDMSEDTARKYLRLRKLPSQCKQERRWRTRKDPFEDVWDEVKSKLEVNRELTDVQEILNWAVGRKPPIIPFNPVRNYKKPKEDNAIIPPPTPDETDAILKNASEHANQAILLSYYLDLRPGAVELLTLTWDRVNWHSETILVISAHKGGPPKRWVPIHEDLLPVLREWYEQDKKTGPIIHYRGKPIKSFKKAWKGTLQRAGITRRIRPYDLRHQFVTKALEEGADIQALADVVGSRPEILMRHYQHVTRELHRRTVAKIPSLKNKKSGF